MMYNSPDWTEEICKLLEEEIHVSTMLWGTIKTEREALRHRDADGLTRASGLKQQCLAELDALEKDRRQMLELAGLPSDRESLDKHLEELLDSHPIVFRWQRLAGLLDQCRLGNAANGQMVAVQRTHVEKALRVLKTGSAMPATYGPDGAPSQGSAARSLSSA